MTSPPSTFEGVLLVALACGIENGSTNAARSAISKSDPLLWWFAQRRLRAMLERGRTLTAHDEPTHVMRLVSLQLVGVENTEDDTPSSVASRYEELVRPTLGSVKRSFWTLKGVFPFVLVAAAVTFYAVTHRPFDPHQIPAASLLEQNLTQWTTKVGTPEAVVTEQRFRTTEAQKTLGTELCQNVLNMLSKGLIASKARPEELKARALEFTQSQGALNLTLERRKLPLFVDGTFLPVKSGLKPLFMTYYVEQDESWQYRGQPLRVVAGWRMDSLRFFLPALGYVREGNPVAIISYDVIEAVLILYLLPSLVENEPAFVFDEKTRFEGDPTVLAIEARLGNVLRQHFRTQRLVSGATDLGKLLAARRNLIAKWRRNIVAFPIQPPQRLLPERDLSEQLEPLISRTDVVNWNQINSELAASEMVTAFEQQRSEWSNAVKRHELQHLIDQKDGLSGIPVVLARRLQVDPTTEPEPFSLFGAARAELSSYLAEVGDGPYPRLSLVQLTAAVFDKNLGNTPHHFAAISIFDGLMKSLGVTADHPTYTEAVLRVIETDPQVTRAKARDLYEEWFGRALTSAIRVRVVEQRHWRH
jgi:hypothetical protein